jgi:rhodanese-related sulfurtransferase
MPKTITLAQLRSRLDSMNPPTLLEALPERYYADKHLPGALHFPHDQVDQLAAAAVSDKAADIVVYCASPTCRNSHIAAQRLIQLGYANVAVYAGGKQEWAEAGLPFDPAQVRGAA